MDAKCTKRSVNAWAFVRVYCDVNNWPILDKTVKISVMQQFLKIIYINKFDFSYFTSSHGLSKQDLCKCILLHFWNLSLVHPFHFFHFYFQVEIEISPRLKTNLKNICYSLNNASFDIFCVRISQLLWRSKNSIWHQFWLEIGKTLILTVHSKTMCGLNNWPI